jgi:alkylation response protein AidB-like acyl-CoA dehydrogenase
MSMSTHSRKKGDKYIINGSKTFITNGSVGDAIQTHSGYGYYTEYAISRHYLDRKLWDIGTGTSEISRMSTTKRNVLLNEDFCLYRIGLFLFICNLSVSSGIHAPLYFLFIVDFFWE